MKSGNMTNLLTHWETRKSNFYHVSGEKERNGTKNFLSLYAA